MQGLARPIWRTLSLFSLLSLGALGVHAQQSAPNVPDMPPVFDEVAPPIAGVAPGDVAVTGFSGVTLAGQGIQSGVDPADKTIIVLDAPSLKVFDLTTLGDPSEGGPLTPPIRIEADARRAGQLFALAVDNGAKTGTLQIWAGATSVFGLPIVSAKADADGTPVRLKQGAPDARFMDGLFGAIGNPGTIWRVDLESGDAVPAFDVTIGGQANSGPGIAGLAFDPDTESVFASDFETGLIVRFAAGGAKHPVAQFDHGVTARLSAGREKVEDDGKRADLSSASFKPDEPETWGMTPLERRVGGLAVKDGRLYYGVAAGQEIWSVGLTPDGGFGTDPRLEAVAKVDKPSWISAIAFNARGEMFAALRGEIKPSWDLTAFVAAESGAVLRFEPENPDDAATPGLWTQASDAFAVGASGRGHEAAGGLSFGHGYGPDGALDLARCDTSLLATGDALSISREGETQVVVHGLQLDAVDALPPVTSASPPRALVDFDGISGELAATGVMGGTAAFRQCDGEAMPPIASMEEPPIVEDGALGEAPAAESGIAGPAGDEVVDDALVDPNAANVGVTKTADCRLVTPEQAECDFTVTAANTGAVPFDLADVILTDAFTTEGPDEPVAIPGAETTGAGFRIPMEDGLPISFKSTFAIPPGGSRVIENCASVAVVGAAEELPIEGDDAPPPADASEFLGLQATPAPVANCTPNADGETQDCTFLVDFTNGSSVQATASFVLMSDPPPLEDFAGPNGSSTETVDGAAVVRGPGLEPGASNQEMRVTGTFPLGDTHLVPTATVVPDVTVAIPKMAMRARAEVALKDAARATHPAIDDEASAFEATPAAFGIGDADPSDDQACVSWDSANPDTPAAPTNEPTQGSPDEMADMGEPEAEDPDAEADEEVVAEADPEAEAKPEPEPVDPAKSNLKVEKTQVCQLFADGAKARCAYEIKLENKGSEPFTFGGGSLLTDTMDGASGTFTGLEVAFQNGAVVDPDGSGFSATADGTTTLAPGELAPPITFGTDFDVPPEGLKVRNCVALDLEPAGTPLPPNETTPTVLEAPRLIEPRVDTDALPPNTPDFSAIVTPQPACLSRGTVKDCEWDVTIENRGNMSGPPVFRFATDSDDVRVLVADGLGANRDPDNRSESTFSSNTVLAPGTAIDVVVRATLPVGAPPVLGTAEIILAGDRNVENNTSDGTAGTEPNQILPGNLVASGDGNADDNEACTEFFEVAPPRLSIAKQSLGDCQKHPRGFWLCRFQATITNESDEDFTRRITVVDSTDLMTATSFPSNWDCTEQGREKTCKSNSPVSIPAGGPPHAIDILTRVPFSSIGMQARPEDCKVTNTITLSDPRAEGVQLTDSDSAQLEIGLNQGRRIKCDPPALELSKVSEGCIAAGDGFDCKFRMTVTSVGPDPFQEGDITIVERLPKGTTARQSGEGWDCTEGADMECALKKVTLAVGETRDLTVTLNVPRSSIGPEQCEIRNEAFIVGSDAPATATASIDSPECRAAPPRACIAGYEGVYPVCCHAGTQRYDAPTNSCVGKCGEGMLFVAETNLCTCPAGQIFNLVRKTCAPAPSCLPGQTGVFPVCCGAGQYYDNGQCKTETNVCSGATPVGLWPNCCPDGYVYRAGANRGCYLRRDDGPTGGMSAAADDPPTSGGRGTGRDDPPSGGRNEVRPGHDGGPRTVAPVYCPDGSLKRRGVPCPRRETVVEPPPVRCPDGSLVRRGQACPKTVAHCPRSRPIGTPPHCCRVGQRYTPSGCQTVGGGQDRGASCPANTYPLRRGNRTICVQKQNNPPKQQQTAPTPRTCGPGQRPIIRGGRTRCVTLDYGSRKPGGTSQPKRCPPNHIGTPPDCRFVGGGGVSGGKKEKIN